jgi:DNA invertase Pin-like site-specific DNA recombinase
MSDDTTGYLIGYARVSTADQNPQMQVDALVRAGVHPDHIHIDTISGRVKVAQRPGLMAALRDSRKGDTLIVWKLDRLGRDTIEVLHTVASLERRGIRLVSLTESLDSRTPIGRMMLTMLAGFAQMERDLIAERTREGLARAMAAGAKPGHPKILVGEKAERARQLLAEPGAKKAAVARALGVAVTTLQKFIREEGA